MIGFFKRPAAPAHACDLGRSAIALPLRADCAAPPGCPVVIVGADGRPRRAAAVAGKRVEVRAGELAWVYHPGPYTVDLAPFAQAPEIGLRTSFAIDPSAGIAAGQRFDLYLAAEVDARLDTSTLGAAIEHTVRDALAQGLLDLPPCTTIEEWNAFRQGLNQLLYMRFGVTVDDCVPVDLGEIVDYAAMLAARLGAAAPVPVAATAAAMPASMPAAEVPAVTDAKAVRRLFLELPCLMCGLRLAALPVCQDQFRQQQALLARLDRLSVEAAAMPALALAAPGQPLAFDDQLRRARHSRRATASLDEAWGLLARLDGIAPERLPALYDEAERIVANLEADCAARRAAAAEVADVAYAAGAAGADAGMRAGMALEGGAA
jgi:hypothetical protein